MDLKSRLNRFRNGGAQAPAAERVAPIHKRPSSDAKTGEKPSGQKPQSHLQKVPVPPAAEELAIGPSRQELEWKHRVHQRMLKMIDLTLLTQIEERQARGQIREITQRVISEEGLPLTVAQRQAVTQQIEDEVLGLGPLEPLLADENISDILINGPKSIYIERFGKLHKTPTQFDDDAHLLKVIDRIVSAVGRRIDESSPMVDARLADGSRVNAIIPPLALDGPAMSIRRFRRDLLGLEQMVEFGTLTASMGDMLAAIILGRLNVVVSGGTGSGKTTTLNMLSGFIPHGERVVTIEDSAELQLRQPHVVRLETRPPNIEGRGEITARDLVRNSLRMRPDRIVVGEVRGHEALDMLQAMNTGHDGSLTTIHANNPRDALMRIENMVAMTGLGLPTAAVRKQIASAVELVLQVQRMEDGRRRMISIQEINGMEGETITMSEIFRFQRTGLDEDGNVLGHFRATGIVPGFQQRLEQRGIPMPLTLFDPDHADGVAA